MDRAQSCPATLKITDITENEVLSYPLIVLKGTISDTCTCGYRKFVSVTHTSEKNTKNCILYIDGNVYKWLFHLDIGENQLLIQHGPQSFTLSCCYAPSSSPYVVKPLLFVCKDNNGTYYAPEQEDNSLEDACKKVTVMSTLAQTTFAEMMSKQGHGKRTFRLEIPENMILCGNLTSDDINKLSDQDFLMAVAKQIINTANLYSSKTKFLVFMCYTKEEDFKRLRKPLGVTLGVTVGGISFYGTRHLYTWPSEVNGIYNSWRNRTPFDDWQDEFSGCIKNYGMYFGVTLGGICHELGHAFDLGHTSYGLMGRDFPQTGLLFFYHNYYVCANTVAENEKKETAVEPESGKFLSKTSPEEQVAERAEYPVQKVLLFRDIKYRYRVDDTAQKIMLTRDCAAFLRYHKWFNTRCSNVPEPCYENSYDNIRGIVKLSVGIAVIQLRDTDSKVLKSWCFSEEMHKTIFIVPSELLNQTGMLVAEDVHGNVMKVIMEHNDHVASIRII